eukprot:580132-Pyramimonas_sp.AAC.1
MRDGENAPAFSIDEVSQGLKETGNLHLLVHLESHASKLVYCEVLARVHRAFGRMTIRLSQCGKTTGAPQERSGAGASSSTCLLYTSPSPRDRSLS